MGCVAGACRSGRPLYCTADTLHSASGSCNATTMHHSHLLPPTLRTHTQPHVSLPWPQLSMQCVHAWWIPEGIDFMKHTAEGRSQASVYVCVCARQQTRLHKKHKPAADFRRWWCQCLERCEGFFAHYLVQPVPRLGEGHRDAGAQVAAGSVAVGQTGYCSFSLQRGETHLNRLAQQQHSLGQRVAETERRERDGEDGYLGFFF